jgi:hypothetical protein
VASRCASRPAFGAIVTDSESGPTQPGRPRGARGIGSAGCCQASAFLLHAQRLTRIGLRHPRRRRTVPAPGQPVLPFHDSGWTGARGKLFTLIGTRSTFRAVFIRDHEVSPSWTVAVRVVTGFAYVATLCARQGWPRGPDPRRPTEPRSGVRRERPALTSRSPSDSLYQARVIGGRVWTDRRRSSRARRRAVLPFMERAIARARQALEGGGSCLQSALADSGVQTTGRGRIAWRREQSPASGAAIRRPAESSCAGARLLRTRPCALPPRNLPVRDREGGA